jgi:hypothetical protein
MTPAELKAIRQRAAEENLLGGAVPGGLHAAL